MSSLTILKGYASNSDDSTTDADDSEANIADENKPDEPVRYEYKSLNSDLAIAINPTPVVEISTDALTHDYVDDKCKELSYNPRYDSLYAPKFGPIRVGDETKLPKNMLTGYIEQTNVSDFQFETQRRTFYSYGYANDPSEASNTDRIVGSLNDENKNVSVFETTKERPKDKRKRIKNDDPSDVDGYLGPWSVYEDQELVSKPNEEQQQEIAEILSKRKKRGRREVKEDIDESKSTLHIKNAYDYLGRSFLHIPQDVGVNLKSETPPDKCFIPKKCVHTYVGHTKGIQKMALFPVSAHLFLTCSMDHKIKLWDFYKDRELIRTYMGHTQGVRDVCFNNAGTEFLSASFDRYLRLWDTETGQCKSRFTTKKIPYCCVFNPEADKQNLFVAGMADKKIICWDTRSGEIVQEYDRHLGAVNTITFVDKGKRIVTSSDDKSVRAWEWDIPVDFKYIADPTMHSMPYVRLSPNERFLAFQSMDNQIKIMEPNANFRWKNKKVFRGHMVAGYACGIDWSPDMSYLISGDADGRLMIWDWKTTRLFEKIKAHTQVCMDVKWHPHETSKILTCGWDGVVKLWD